MNKAALSVIIVLGLAVLLVITQTLPPPAVPTTAPAGEFSAQRAMRHIETIGQVPHPAGSVANQAVRNYILAELKNLVLETQTQRDGNLENVIGKIAGTNSSDAVLLTAHLDSVAQAPGATDDGSGVAVLLETARALTSGSPLRNTVMFLFSDDEEGGLNGAKAFIAHHPWAKDVKIVIGFDAGGLTGPGVLSTTSENNGWLIAQLAKVDPYFVGSSAITTFANSSTDFGRAFKPAGYSGYAFDLYWDRRLHTPDDNIQNVNVSSLQQQGDHALVLARHFGNLDGLVDPQLPNAVYFSVLRRFTVAYSPTSAILVATAVTGLFFGVLIFGLKQRILTWAGMRYGILNLFVGILIAPLPAVLLGHWGTNVPLRYYGYLLTRPPQVAIVTFLSLILILFWFFLSLRITNISTPNMILGALLPMWVGMLGSSLIFPTLSFALTWPLLFSSLACAIWFYGSVGQKDSNIVVFVLPLCGAANIILLGPTIVLGLFDQMAIALLLLGVLCGFILPQIYLMLGILNRNG